MPVIGTLDAGCVITPKKQPIRNEETDVMLEQLSFIIEQGKEHGNFCKCPDCITLHAVGPMLLRKFEATKGKVKWK